MRLIKITACYPCLRSSSILPPSASPILPKPPQGNRRRVNKTASSMNPSTSFPAFETNQTEPSNTAISTTTTTTTTTAINNTTATTTTTTTTTTNTATTTTTTTATPAQHTKENPPVPTKRRTTMSAGSSGEYVNTSPVSTSASFPFDKSTDDSLPKRPVPVPRRSTLDRGLMGSSPLVLSTMRSPNTSSSTLPSVNIKIEEEKGGLQQQKQPRKESSSSMLSTSSSLSIGSMLQGKESTNSDDNLVIPIALAIQETVNASFKGKTYENLFCVCKYISVVCVCVYYFIPLMYCKWYGISLW